MPCNMYTTSSVATLPEAPRAYGHPPRPLTDASTVRTPTCARVEQQQTENYYHKHDTMRHFYDYDCPCRVQLLPSQRDFNSTAPNSHEQRKHWAILLAVVKWSPIRETHHAQASSDCKRRPHAQTLQARDNRRLWSRVVTVVRVLASHQCVPSSILGLHSHAGCVLLVLYPATRSFSSDSLVSPFPHKKIDSVWFELTWKSFLISAPALEFTWFLNKVDLLLLLRRLHNVPCPESNKGEHTTAHPPRGERTHLYCSKDVS